MVNFNPIYMGVLSLKTVLLYIHVVSSYPLGPSLKKRARWQLGGGQGLSCFPNGVYPVHCLIKCHQKGNLPMKKYFYNV